MKLLKPVKHLKSGFKHDNTVENYEISQKIGIK